MNLNPHKHTKKSYGITLFMAKLRAGWLKSQAIEEVTDGEAGIGI